MKYKTDDLRIEKITEVLSPDAVHARIKVSEAARQTIHDTRQAIHHILQAEDDRLLVVIGPCSIHDPDAAREYASLLKTAQQVHVKDLLIVMRVYFEKPRTSVGWKGLINDPNLDDSCEINQGLQLARQLLADINDMGVPAGTEFLDLVTPQYVADLVSWGAIGARTTESQVHRELASGLSCPVGFKNSTNGSLKAAIDAVRAAGAPHRFLSMTKAGHSAIFSTSGNQDCHVILRGGSQPNYDAASIARAILDHQAAGIDPRLMVDFSHANSGKQAEQQLVVGQAVADQIADGNRAIIGVMIESHLQAGRQDVDVGTALEYGKSITDACISWQQSEPLLSHLAQSVQRRR